MFPGRWASPFPCSGSEIAPVTVNLTRHNCFSGFSHQRDGRPKNFTGGISFGL